jgi:hypothetical protein
MSLLQVFWVESLSDNNKVMIMKERKMTDIRVATIERNKIIIDLYTKGLSTESIGSTFNMTPTRINQILREHASDDVKKARKNNKINALIDKGREEFKEYFEKYRKIPTVSKLVSILGENKPNEHISRCHEEMRNLPIYKDSLLETKKEQLIHELQRVATLIGKTPCTKDVRAHSAYSIMMYVRFFGSVKNAQLAAGLKPNEHGGKKITETDKIVSMYQQGFSAKVIHETLGVSLNRVYYHIKKII